MRHPELLIPAGDLETLKIAVMYGAMQFMLAESFLVCEQRRKILQLKN